MDCDPDALGLDGVCGFIPYISATVGTVALGLGVVQYRVASKPENVNRLKATEKFMDQTAILTSICLLFASGLTSSRMASAALGMIGVNAALVFFCHIFPGCLWICAQDAMFINKKTEDLRLHTIFWSLVSF